MTLIPCNQPDARRATETPTDRKVPAMTDIALDPTATRANRSAAPRRAAGRKSLIISMGVLAAATSALLGPASAQPAVTASAASTATSSSQTASVDLTARAAAAARSSRSSSREAVSDSSAAPEAVATRYATVALNVRTASDADADLVTVLEAGSAVKITAETEDGWRQILYKGKAGWVNGKYLSKSKPSESESGDLSTKACTTGSSVEMGLKANAVAVHRAVCARFPQVKSYGGYRSDPGSNHNSGRALDIMVSGSRGDDIAAYLKANASDLGITEIIWEQEIWTTQRAGDGWRQMEDRGSATANHFDHVHVSVR